MTVRRGRLPYVDKDYESIREELMARIPQLTDRWTDMNPSDLGVVLLELFAGTADMLAYYIDAQAAECYLPTARQRPNIASLCALVGYTLHGPVAASTRVRFTLTQPEPTNVTIPAGTLVRAADEEVAISFVTISDAVLLAGDISIEADALQGELVSESFAATGTVGARLVLNRTDVAHGSVLVKVGGVSWEEVQHFADSDSNDIHYRVDTDGLDVVSIVFGDGTCGMLPNEGRLVEVTYISTQGASGNIAPHRVNTVASAVRAPDGRTVGLAVDNFLAATGGADKETLEHARLVAPSTVRSTWKAVTREDYRSLCLAFPGVAKARIIDVNDDVSLRIYSVRVCIAPEGGGLPSDLLKSSLWEYLEARRLLTIDAGIVDPVYVPISIDAQIWVYPGEDPETVRRRAADTLAEHFSFANQDFGQRVYPSDLVVLLDGVEGVSHVSLREPLGDIVLGQREIPVLGTITLTISEVR